MWWRGWWTLLLTRVIKEVMITCIVCPKSELLENFGETFEIVGICAETSSLLHSFSSFRISTNFCCSDSNRSIFRAHNFFSSVCFQGKVELFFHSPSRFLFLGETLRCSRFDCTSIRWTSILVFECVSGGKEPKARKWTKRETHFNYFHFIPWQAQFRIVLHSIMCIIHIAYNS